MVALARIPADSERLDAMGVLRIAIERLASDRLALSASFGPEDMVLLDMMCGLVPRPRVFTLDTGRLPQETHELMDRVRRRFGVTIEVYVPEREQVDALISERGVDLFYRSVQDRLDCCAVRKVEPLRRALATVDGWVTGVRRDQSPTRAATPKIGLDLEHGLIWKVAPLADWTEQQVWSHIRDRELPYNALHDRGYRSIGCDPCTRAVAPGEHERAGRWWWEQAEARECGLHDPVTLAGARTSAALRGDRGGRSTGIGDGGG